MAINGAIQIVYADHDNTTAVFPVTLTGAVYTSEGLLLEDAFQRKLVSGSNIQSINGDSILKSGNLQLEPADSTIIKEADIVDNLTSSLANAPLSAKQGKELKDLIDSLPSAMVFKGSLGTGGTITSLPAASTTIIGYTYQVITEGTYAGQLAKVGDLFVCNDTPAWTLLPTASASGTVMNIATGDGIIGGPITTTGTIKLDTSGVVAGTYPKVTVDKYGRVTVGSVLVADDIPSIDAIKITSGQIPDTRIASASTWNDKVDKNTAITGATKTKITYDSKGLVTAGADLIEADIPNLSLSKIPDITASATELNILDGATVTTAELNFVDGVSSNIQDQLNNKVEKNASIVGATKTKITYDAKGLVTAGADLAATDIPDLDAAKITSGTFSNDRLPTLDVSKIPSLDTSKITTGVFDEARIPVATTSALGAVKPDGTTITISSGVISAEDELPPVAGSAGKILKVKADASGVEWAEAGGTGTVTSIIAGTGLTGGTITTTGTIAHDAVGTAGTYYKVTTDTLGHVSSGVASLVDTDIPDLDASKITTGTFDVARIPDLDTTKITTGVFDVARIPDLDAAKIISGTLDAARIPTLDTSKIPDLDASKITTGMFDATRIPSLDVSKITSGTFVDDRIASATIWNSKYDKPTTGIPKADLASDVQTSLGLADTALQSVPSTYRTSADQDVIDATKQDKILAGTNIQIAADGKTISATDTTYSVFSATADGLVPKATDTSKFLKGDGTWADAGKTYTASKGVTLVSEDIELADATLDNGISVASGVIKAEVDEGIEIDFTTKKIAHIRDMSKDTAQSAAVAAVDGEVAPGTAVSTSSSNVTFKYDDQGHINGKMFARANYGTITLPASAAGDVDVNTPAAMAITADDTPILDIVVSSASAQASELATWAKVWKAKTGAGKITFSLSDATTTAITVQIKN